MEKPKNKTTIIITKKKFAYNMIKLLVNEIEWTGFLPQDRGCFLKILI